MQYRQMGTSGLKVSPICLGALMFGDETSSATARRIVAMARDAGINFIDTADMYVLGESEREVGRLEDREQDQQRDSVAVKHPVAEFERDDDQHEHAVDSPLRSSRSLSRRKASDGKSARFGLTCVQDQCV